MKDVWNSVMPSKFEKSSTQAQRVQQPPKVIPSTYPGAFSCAKNQATWSSSALQEEFFDKFCQVVQASLKIFVNEEDDRQPSQPPENETGLTQHVQEIDMNAGEPPEEIFQRHNTFEFEPVIETNQEEKEDIFNQADDKTDLVEIFDQSRFSPGGQSGQNFHKGQTDYHYK